MAGIKEINANVDLKGKLTLHDVPYAQGTGVVVYNPATKDITQRLYNDFIADAGLINATNIAAAYYTKTQLQTSGQASVNWGNITEKPTTFPATAHNHDDRYYTETESDTYFVPYTGANKSIDFNTQQLTLNGTFEKKSNVFELSHLGNDVYSTAGQFKRLTDVASLTLSSSTGNGDIIITIPIRATTKWVMEVDIFTSGVVLEKLLISGYSTANSGPQVSCLTDTEIISEVKFCRDTNNNTVLVLKRATGTSAFSYGKVNINDFYHAVTHHPDLAVKSNYKVEFIDESTLTGITVNSTIKVDKVNFGTKNIDFTSGSISKNQNGVRHFRDVYHGYTALNTDKILSIKFPPQTAQATMFRIEIDFYQYAANSGNYVGKLIVSFYKTSNTNIHASTGLSFYWSGDKQLQTSIIKVGFDSSGNICINIGDSTTDWASLTSFRVSSVESKYTGWNQDYSKGWTNEFISDETGYTGLVTVPLIISANQDWVESGGRTPNGYVELGTLDLNTVIIPGFYYQKLIANATLVCNYPSEDLNAGSLKVYKASNSGITQEYDTYSSNLKFTRTSTNGGTTWTTWKRFIDSTDIVLTDLHSHSNKTFLDTINQNLGSGYSVLFNGVGIGKFLTTYNGFNSISPFAFLNNSAAQQIYTGGVLASSAYADATKIPANGIYSKGTIVTGSTIEIQNNQGTSSASPLTISRSSQVGLSFKIADVDNFLGVDAGGVLRYGLNASHMTNYMIWHSGNFNPSSYATLAGTQTFSGTNTFSLSPIVPAGTLAGHAVNKGQLDAINIGGRNYFKNSDFSNNSLTGWSSSYGTQSIINGVYTKVITTESGAARLEWVNGDSYLTELGDYVVTFKYKSTHALIVQSLVGATLITSNNPLSSTTEWLISSFNINITNLSTLILRWYVQSPNLNATVEFDWIKIEKGNKSTDWTPAPEDQVSDWNQADATAFNFIKNKPTIPTVNNGTLTLSTGTGLSGSATFGANQGTGVTFSVGIDSGYKLPTTAEWNGKYTLPTGGTTSQYINGLGNLATFPTIPQGTVTSVAMTAPTGLSVTGSPITSSGTLALSYATGYQGYTTAEATKLAGMAAAADNYGSWNLKTNGAQRIAVVSGGTLDLVAGTNVSLTYAAEGIVTINSTNTTYSVFTTNTAGLVPGRVGSTITKYLREDGTWVVPPDNNTVYTAGTGLSLNGTVFSHPTTAGNKHIPAGGVTGQILRWSADGTAVWGADNNTVYSAGTKAEITTNNANARVWTGAVLNSMFADYIPTTHLANGITSTNISNWNLAYSGHHTHGNYAIINAIVANDITNWNNKVNRTGDTITGNLLFTPVGNPFPVIELRTDNFGGRNDIYLRSDSGNVQQRISVADDGYYTFTLGPTSGGGVGMGNATGFDYLQIPGSNSQLRVGFFATQIPGYMSAISGSGYFGGDILSDGKSISNEGFVHDQYNDPNAVLISDGGVAYTELDIINSGGQLRIQPFEFDATAAGDFIGSTYPHRLVYIFIRGGNTVELKELQPYQRIIIMNWDSASASDVNVDGAYAGKLGAYEKISVYVNENSTPFFYDKTVLYPGGGF